MSSDATVPSPSVAGLDWHLLVPGTAVAIDGRAVLLTGTSGSGKSDLALRLIDEGASLIADDVTELHGADQRLMARFPQQAPENLRGRLEVRGLGIMPVRVTTQAVPLILVAELVDAGGIDRLPEPALAKYGDFNVALVKLAPFEASATAKLRLAVSAVAGHIMAPL
jgi:hypothetical protein